MHAELIARLESLEGPDVEADADLLEVAGGCAHRETEYYCIEDGNDYDSGFTCKRCGKETYGQRIPAYTASLDAAIALVEQQGLQWLRRSPSSMSVYRKLSEQCHADGPSPAIALLIAALRALDQHHD